MFAHLQDCPDCANRVDAWRRSIRKLESLSLMERKRGAGKRTKAFTPGDIGIKWGLAASILIFIGFAIGRFSMPSEQALEAKVTRQVRENVRQQLRSDLLAALGQDAGAQDAFQKQLHADLASAAPGKASEMWKQDVLNTVQAQRDQDQQQLLALINHLRDLQVADSLALRQDLETAVLTADRDLRQNSSRINQLASTISTER